ncbi:MAG: hypothetical protein WC746_05565 [archaeon]
MKAKTKPRKRPSLSEFYFGKGTRFKITYQERFNLIQQRVGLAGWKRILVNPELQEKFAKRYKLPLKDVLELAKSHVWFADSKKELVDSIHSSLKRVAVKVPAEERVKYLTAVSSWLASTNGRAELTKTEEKLAVQIISAQLEKIIPDPKQRRLWQRLVEKHGNALAI